MRYALTVELELSSRLVVLAFEGDDDAREELELDVFDQIRALSVVDLLKVAE